MKTPTVQVVLAALVLGVIGLVAVWTGQPLLAPSLASAAYAQILTPRTSSATAWSAGAGQIAGLVGGFVGVFASGAFAAPMFMGGHPLVDQRVLAAVIAIVVGAGLQLAIRATCPAGGATAVVVAIGAETASLDGAARMLVAIMLVTALGEAARRVILRMSYALDRRREPARGQPLEPFI